MSPHEQERARAGLPVPRAALDAWTRPRALFDGVPAVVQEIAAPVVAAAYREQAWAMLKGFDPTGAWYRPTLDAATRLFDAAHALDGRRDHDEPAQRELAAAKEG